MEFDIDVSGEDLLNSNYAVAVSNNNNITYGFRFSQGLIQGITNSFNREEYKYKGNSQRINLKIRLYCLVVYYIFMNILKDNQFISNEKHLLRICLDFPGHQNDIKLTLKALLENKLGLVLIEPFIFGTLSEDSNAHKFACKMRKRKKQGGVEGIEINLSKSDCDRNLVKIR